MRSIQTTLRGRGQGSHEDSRVGTGDSLLRLASRLPGVVMDLLRSGKLVRKMSSAGEALCSWLGDLLRS